MTAALYLASCGSSGIRAPVGDPGEVRPWRAPKTVVKSSGVRQHVVRRGETLYAIAWRHGIDYQDLAGWNEIAPPYTIYPGQKLTLIPTEVQRRARAPAKDRAPAAKTRPDARKPSAARASKPKNTRAAAEKNTGKRKIDDGQPPGRASGADRVVSQWHWPAKGQLITAFKDSGHKGVNIAGQLGTPVYAAAHGRVVYTGGGLRGYGELIIVKHNHRYLSAYAHNNKLLVQEGDTVTGGQRIAEMGRTGTDRVMLHFEIRRDGKPVDPIAFLPKQ
ncbi:MAG: peptidoglycan DD-metalloendopeptidase family protein [Gammaproteobacteria bacterium]|nr:peptidoglycan DD-metalloendopeptidase family protein [Gammaproteobacteria bacterium]NIR82852.1 peptidoglycan DD-metalloendopeptidase family protein [Gammaproteobacteria bacterium]NIR89961.1 peptidoglycan DD-metalloendopeptidase family protein [Gammaproteobacteria bacterium]NIU04010.1 peptidoglycan DD-metalloendopeptidase family protein [Gammaproteobacteria bacterium]NIV51330.1 peptidoglycan DD-metalloendopeptidase family protein [Gammaproteobacteria bacterium]